MDCENISVPSWLQVLYPGVRPVRAAIAGGQAYLIIEWPEGFDFRCLPVPKERLGLYTQRAMICTSVNIDSKHDNTIDFRYFAPQYGVDEDIATGSAMRVLACYWNKPELIAKQLLSERGLLFARRGEQGIDVGGYCDTANEITL